ncbi:ABC transporter permease, partial [Klebsiella pneumoniae]|nr:ABC transporter permease [Klebsiella pneumoniae]
MSPEALALVSTPAWWVKGRRKVRASPVLQTLLLLFMLLAMFGPLL